MADLNNPLLLFTAQIVSILSVSLLAAGYYKTDPSSTSSKIFATLSVFVVFYLLSGMDADHIDSQFRLIPGAFPEEDISLIYETEKEKGQ